MGESKNEEVAWGGAVDENVGYSSEFLKSHSGVCFSSGVVKKSIEKMGWDGGGGRWSGG